MSKIEVNTVEPQCGTTLTLGGSGDTVALGSGASQTGFGREGSVNWQTTIKTGDFTAVSGEGYFVNTTSGEIDVTLPLSPSVGDIVAVSDYAKNFGTNNCIMLRNGSNIQGAAANLTLDAEGLAMTFVYADVTKGWIVVGAGRQADSTAKTFIVATSCGTITTDGDYKIHTFTGPGTFTVCSVGNAPTVGDKVEYLVVAGGGGGGGGYQSGGGGAGGYRESPGSVAGGFTASPRGVAPAAAVTVTAQGYPIVVGGGGPAGPATPSSLNYGQRGTQGSTSSALGISSAGGGSGGAFADGTNPTLEVGGNGGSGGGAGRSPATNSEGTGNTPPTNPVQGTNGGSTTTPYTAPYSGGAGGGALTPGGPGQGGCFGVGGNGATSGISGTPVVRAGGGGSGSGSASPGASTGGPGGGGDGGWGPGSGGDGSAGTANTGGGGGGAGYESRPGGNGGGGVVVIRYQYQG